MQPIALEISQGRHRDRLDGVHAVFRLLEGDARWRLEYVLGDFDAVGQVRVLFGDLLADLGLELWNAGRQCMNLVRGLPVDFISSLFTGRAAAA